MAKNYYIILGVSREATQDEIKSAYRQQVKTYHPDHYGADSGPFLAIQEAYAVLSDPARRQTYDSLLRERRLGSVSEGVRPEPVQSRPLDAEPLIPDEGPGDFGVASLNRSFQTFGPSFDELFDRLWSNFDGLMRPKAERLESLSVEIPITPEQAMRGGHIRVMVPARAICPTCRGRGGVGMYECWRCAGEGEIRGEFPVAVAFPAGIPNDYVVQIPLDRYGIYNFYLTAHFRVSRM